MTKKLGIYAGTFDPVHEGHEAFVRAAITAAGLDTIIIVPERQPHKKQQLAPLSERISMLELVFQDVPNVSIATISGDFCTYDTIMHELPVDTDELYLLVGSDAITALSTWSSLTELLARAKFVVGMRESDNTSIVRQLFTQLAIPEERYSIITTAHAASSSSCTKSSQHFHPKIVDYIRKHHLYSV